MDCLISIIIPVRNEEKYIKKCILSLLNQDYKKEFLEIIFVDGISSDKTCEIITDYINQYPDLFKLFSNKNKTVPYAMNIGISNSKGNYIIRMDAHSEYMSDYVSRCAEKLNTIDAEMIGGNAITKGNGFIGETIALLLSSPFGVGNSKFRINGRSGYVDTVPFGAFKRDTFLKIGLYDVRLTRNEDNELSYRIRKNGGKIYLSNEIKFIYYCRNTIKGLIKMGYQNGKWSIVASYYVPKSMSIRHFIPLLFTLSLIVGLLSILFEKSIFITLLFTFEFFLYLIISFYFSIKSNANSMLKKALLFFLFPIFHISYGLGSLLGIFKVFIIIINSAIKKVNNKKM